MRSIIIFFVFISSLSLYGTQGVAMQVSGEDDTRSADNQGTPFEKDILQTEMFKDALVTADFYLRGLKNDPHNVRVQQNAVRTYNLVKEMLGEKPVQSFQDIIDDDWLKQKQYESFKRQEQDEHPMTNIRMWALVIGLQYHLDRLKSQPNNAFNQREALFSYNYLLELAGEKPVKSWKQIDLEKAESFMPSNLRRFFEPLFYSDFWISWKGSLVLATILAYAALYIHVRHQMAAAMAGGLMGAIPPGAVPVFAPAAAAA